jgi:hypothetical protein
MSYLKLFKTQRAEGRGHSVLKHLAFCALRSVLRPLLFALCPLLANAQTPQESSCITCHKLLDGKLLAPVTAWENDIHAQNGLGCESCHGGNPSPAVAEDPDAAKSRAAGFIGKPARKNIPLLCGNATAIWR